MGKKRHMNTGDILTASLSNGDSSPEVDLSSFTRASAYLVVTGTVTVMAQATPDDSSVSTASANWFDYWSSSDTGMQMTAESAVIPLPPGMDGASQAYSGNVNAPCAARMRIKVTSGAGAVASCAFAGHRTIG